MTANKTTTTTVKANNIEEIAMAGVPAVDGVAEVILGVGVEVGEPVGTVEVGAFVGTAVGFTVAVEVDEGIEVTWLA